MDISGLNSDVCHMFITYDKPYFYQGDQVSGRINLNVTGTYPASFLKLTIKGVEKIEHSLNSLPASDAPSSANNNKKTEKRNPIPKNEALLYTFKDSKILPGQYSYPFKFSLDSRIPTSFKYQDEKCKAQIYYKIKAILESKQCNLVKKKIFQVAQNVLNESKNETFIGKTQISSCCNDEGFFVVNFLNTKATYSLNEDENIKINLDLSNCHNDAIVVTVRLLQDLSFHLPNSQQSMNSRLYGRDLIRNQIIAGYKSEFEFKLCDKLPTKEESKFSPSCIAGIIECKHKLVVITDFSGACQNLKQLQPNEIPIHFSKIEEPEKNELPQIWNPIIEKPNNILYNPSKPIIQDIKMINEQIKINEKEEIVKL